MSLHKKKTEAVKFSPHTRKSLVRMENVRDTLEVILIICEGQKDELKYFQALRNELQLNRQRIVIEACQRGSNPKNIIEEAIERDEREEYDRVYCVFDHDSREKEYREAIERIKSKNKNVVKFFAITSVPCFEFWILLHYVYSTKQYKQVQPGRKSVSEQLISEIRKYYPNCKKHLDTLYEDTRHLLPQAIERAKKLEREKIDDPSTKIHILVEFLKKM
jgi:hypothetical protein